MITSLSRAHGLIRVPPGAEGLEAGAQVCVELLRSRAEIDATVVLAGSHDLALSWLDDLVRRTSPFAGIAAQALGSLGGLIALSRGAAHVAGIHLLDPASGEYNLPYVRQHLPGRPVTLITLAHREQGLMVAPGNPLGLTGVEDLACPDRRPRLANRQRGSGTRVLLDHLLTTSGVGPAQVRGYAHEELTHLAAAMAVRTGMADAALGIRAVPAELGLGFETVAWERFDLVVPDDHLELPQVSRLLDAVTSDAFKAVLSDLPGYDAKETGRRRHAEASVTAGP